MNSMQRSLILGLVVLLSGCDLARGLSDQFGTDRSPAPASVSASAIPASPSSVTSWGPLAIIPPQDGADTARTEGTLRITDSCVSLDRPGGLTVLVWPADRTTWQVGTRSVAFMNFDGTVATVADGDQVAIGGSGDSTSDSGISGGDWVRSVHWVSAPAATCPLADRWFVGAVGPSR